MTAIRQNIGRVGLRMRNEWTANPQDPYKKMDVVSKDGSSYVSLVDNNTTTPPSESWQIQSQRGEVGHGVKEGGSAGQVLTKKSGTDYDTEWKTPVDAYSKTEVDNITAPFITKSVNDLTNYYLKSETYTKTEVQALIAAIQQFHYEIYESTSAVVSPASNVLYLIGPTGTGADKYEEYIYPDNTKGWTKIGDTTIDLSGYYTSAQTNTAIANALNTALADYTTTAALTLLLAGKQDVISDLSTIRSGASAGATAYQKPQTGIPSTDMSESVQTSLGKADTALQSQQQADWDESDNTKADFIKNKPIIPTIPTNVSSFTNDAGYITKSVNDLVNYYLKSEVYTKTEVANLIAAIQQFHYEIYASISAVTTPAGNVLYLIGPTGSGSDKYEEYVYDSTKQEPWIKIGDTSIDLSGYVTTTALNTTLADYTTTAALTLLLAGKQDTLTFNTTPSSSNKVATMADVPTQMGASGSGHKGGLVPDTPSTAGDTKYLREDGTWAVPAGGGGGSAYTPTLLSAPTSSTTTYTKDGQTVNFEIGQFARVAKQGGGYDMYQLYDLSTAGEPAVTVASWEKVENDNRELLQLNLTTDQTGLLEDPLTGTTVKVVVLDGQDTEMWSGTWAGEQISVRVNTFYRYKVVLGNVSGYITPHPKPLTPMVNNVRNLTVQYVKGTIDTIYIDDSISDPAAKVTGDVNGAMLQVIRSHFHRYLAKYVDGTLKMCQLNDSNSLLFWDNTTAKTDGTMGDVFVTCDIPFYTHYEKDANGRHVISFSIVEQTGWKEWHFGFGNDRDAIGAYEMSVKNDVGRSVSGVGSTGNITQGQAVQYAGRFGGRCVEQRDQNIIGTLFYALYGHTNCQVVCGYGTNSYDKVNGTYTDALGMTDTVGNGGNGDNGSVNFLGLENWWGNKAEWMGNIGFNVNSVDYKYAITEPDGTTRTVQGHNTANQHVYKRGMHFGENLDLIGTPDSVNGTDSTGYCDSNYHGNQAARVVCRSNSSASSYGGVAFAFAYHASSDTFAGIGSRLAFRGTTELVEDVAEYLAL